MSKAPVTVLAARGALFAGVLVSAVLMVGPFQGLEQRLLLSDKEAHAIAFFGLTLLSFLAFPKLRKNDLALVAIAFGGAAEIAQGVVGRNMGLDDMVANGVGIFFAWAPMQVEQLRRQARRVDMRRRMSDPRPARTRMGPAAVATGHGGPRRV